VDVFIILMWRQWAAGNDAIQGWIQEEWHRDPRLIAAQHSMGCGFELAAGSVFKNLSDIDDEGSGKMGNVLPFAIGLAELQAGAIL